MDYYSPHAHVGVLHPDGSFIDVFGKRPQAKVQEEWMGGACKEWVEVPETFYDKSKPSSTLPTWPTARKLLQAYYIDESERSAER